MTKTTLSLLLELIENNIETSSCPDCGSDFESMSTNEDVGCNAGNCKHYHTCKAEYEKAKKNKDLLINLHEILGKMGE